MSATRFETPAIAEDALNEATRIKSIVTDAVEDGVRNALKAIKRGRHVAEDAIDDARHSVVRQPFQAVGVVFAIGVLLGSTFTWLATRRG